jgi:hypothetical protein
VGPLFPTRSRARAVAGRPTALAPDGRREGRLEGRHFADGLFEPFEILRHSNQETYRKEKQKAGSGREMEIWLLR